METRRVVWICLSETAREGIDLLKLSLGDRIFE